MANENTSTNTPAAPPPAAAPAPDPVESRRQAIMNEPEFWKDGPKTQALRNEMKSLLANAKR
jgi:hypothetical protein